MDSRAEVRVRPCSGPLVDLVGVLVGVVVAGIFLSACTAIGENGTPAQRMRSWQSATGLTSDIDTLRSDASNLRRAESEHVNGKVLHGLCAAMLDDSESAYGELPTPDNKTTNLLSDAYNDFGSAANLCYNNAADVSLPSGVNGDLADAETRLADAQARIAALLGQ